MFKGDSIGVFNEHERLVRAVPGIKRLDFEKYTSKLTGSYYPSTRGLIFHGYGEFSTVFCVLTLLFCNCQVFLVLMEV